MKTEVAVRERSALPKTILLRRVLKPKLIATFIGVVAVGTLLVGYVFDAVHWRRPA